jgi:valyl-tRNA synthetase
MFPVFVQVQSDQETKLFELQTPAIGTLIKGCKSVKVVKDINEVPAGCGSEILTPTIVIHVLVRVRESSPRRSQLLKLL